MPPEIEALGGAGMAGRAGPRSCCPAPSPPSSSFSDQSPDLCRAGSRWPTGCSACSPCDLVTGMSRMCRTPAGLSGQLRGEVPRTAARRCALTIPRSSPSAARPGDHAVPVDSRHGPPGRRGRRSRAPPPACRRVVLCWLLCRRAIRLNVGVFFSGPRSPVVIVACVLSPGLGDLQDAGGAARPALDRVRPDRTRPTELVVGPRSPGPLTCAPR